MSEMDVRGDGLAEDALDERPPREVGVETPEADAAEQRRADRETDQRREDDLPFDVDPADDAEQNRTVDLDDDDYR
ncbi:hypothetical protein [Streptosporangium sp. KLBMP 9127]|nr:hypothetical protein [Streptosporangium sp. KLBMP 9127]